MKYPKEFKIVALRECPLPSDMQVVDSPPNVEKYFYSAIATNPAFNSYVENFFVVLVNTRRRAMGHFHVSMGTADTVITHAREVFRGAIIASATAVILIHNHPSGDSTPSEADIKVTRELIKAGQLLKIEVLDHVIIGKPNPEKGYASLREFGYFYS